MNTYSRAEVWWIYCIIHVDCMMWNVCGSPVSYPGLLDSYSPEVSTGSSDIPCTKCVQIFRHPFYTLSHMCYTTNILFCSIILK